MNSYRYLGALITVMGRVTKLTRSSKTNQARSIIEIKPILMS